MLLWKASKQKYINMTTHYPRKLYKGTHLARVYKPQLACLELRGQRKPPSMWRQKVEAQKLPLSINYLV